MRTSSSLYLPLLLGAFSLAMANTPLSTLPAGAEILTLDNGLRVLLLPDPASPVVACCAQVGVGTNDEEWSRKGVSHMLEHLLFGGSERYSQQELYDLVDSRGGYNNANTAATYTNFMVLMPAEDLRLAMEVQSEMLFHSTMPAERVEIERGIILEELAGDQSREDPAEAAWQAELVHGSSAAGPALGSVANISSLDRDTIFNWYKHWYSPANTVMEVVGNFEAGEARELLNEYFGTLPGVDMPAHQRVPIALQPGFLQRQVAGVSESLRLAWPAPALDEEGTLAAQALSELGANVLEATLDRDWPGAFERVEFSYSDTPAAATFEVKAQLRGELSAKNARQALWQAAAALGSAEFTQEELAALALEARTEMARHRERPHFFSMMYADAFSTRSFDWALSMPSMLAELSPADLRLCASDYLCHEPMSMLLTPPQDAAAANRQEFWRGELENGVTLVVDSLGRSELFAMQVVLRGRSVWEGPQLAGALEVLQHLRATATLDHDETTLEARIRELGASFTLYDNPWIPFDDYQTSNGHVFLRMELPPANWRAGCELLQEMLLSPRITSDAVAAATRPLLMALRRNASQAGELADEKLNHLLFADTPLELQAGGTMRTLAAVDSSSLVQLQSIVTRPDNLILAACGPVSADSLRRFWSEAIPARDPSSQDLAWCETLSWRTTFLNDEGTLKSGAFMPALCTETTVLCDTLSASQGALRMGSIIEVRKDEQAGLRLLGAVLSSRLATHLREERGLAYSVGAAASALNNEREAFWIWMDSRAQNLDEARELIQNELKQLRREGVTAEELNLARLRILGGDRMRRLTSINRARYLALDELAHEPGGHATELAALQEVSQAEVQELAKRYLGSVNWQTVLIY